jgi:hypothetical protein
MRSSRSSRGKKLCWDEGDRDWRDASAYVSIRQHTSAYEEEEDKRNTSAYVSIRQHSSAYELVCWEEGDEREIRTPKHGRAATFDLFRLAPRSMYR